MGSGQVGKDRRTITWFFTFTFVKTQEGSTAGEGGGGVGRDRQTDLESSFAWSQMQLGLFQFCKSINSLLN